MANCGECKNFIKMPDVAYGRCKVRKFCKTRWYRKETNKEFFPYRSRNACGDFDNGTTITNYDRIKNMTVDELAKFIPDWSYTKACKCDEKPYVDCNNECWKCVKEWLESEVDE